MASDLKGRGFGWLIKILCGAAVLAHLTLPTAAARTSGREAADAPTGSLGKAK